MGIVPIFSLIRDPHALDQVSLVAHRVVREGGVLLKKLAAMLGRLCHGNSGLRLRSRFVSQVYE